MYLRPFLHLRNHYFDGHRLKPCELIGDVVQGLHTADEKVIAHVIQDHKRVKMFCEIGELYPRDDARIVISEGKKKVSVKFKDALTENGDE